MTLQHDLLASLGEFVGTTMFLFLAFGGAKTALYSRSFSIAEDIAPVLENQAIVYISLSFGLGLLVTAWVFYRVTGALFNPAITFALWLIGGLTLFRACLLFIAQMLGAIAASALIAGLTPFGGISSLQNTLGPGISIAQGLFLEALLTSFLVLTVLLLAAEKHKSTFLAPIGIGLVLLTCHLVGIVWTGCGMNPARAFGPSVISGSFPTYHWLYWLGPTLGSLMAVSFYLLLKACDYTLVVAGQDADHEDPESQRHPVGADIVRQAVGKIVVFHHPGANEATGIDIKGGEIKSEDTIRAPHSPVIAFDPHSEIIKDAIRDGEATIIDLGITSMRTGGDNDGLPTGSRLYGCRGSAFTVRQIGDQDLGAVMPPGTESSGLASLPLAKALIQS